MKTISQESDDLQASDVFTVPGSNEANEAEPLESLLGSLHDLPSLGDQDGHGKQGKSSSQTGIAELRTSVDHLFSDLEKLAKKHQVERSQCLAGWLLRQGSVFERSGCSEPSGQQGSAVHNNHQINFLQMTGSAVGVLPDAARQTMGVQATKQELPSKPSDELSQRQGSLGKTHTVSTLATKHKKGKKKKKHGLIVSTPDVIEKNRLQEFTTSRGYEIGSAALIALNSMTIGWQVQWTTEKARELAEAHSTQPAETVFFKVLAPIFTFAFTVELGLRWVGDGFFEFFQTDELCWCIFDVFIVSIGLLELLLGLIFAGSMPFAGEITLLRILRVMRIVKVLRVIRVMRFFRELRMMIWSIAGSIKSLMWVMLVLALLFYIFGILITQGVESFLTDNKLWLETVQYEDLIECFGTLDRAMLSLFMAMSGGNDWSLYYNSLKPLDLQYRMVFLIFIVFSIFAVVNIVTGVFVQSAMNSSSQDREIVVHEELENKRQYCEAMREFFEEVDGDCSGMIGYKEFTDKLSDERVLAYFNALKLDVSDAHTLFKLLDFDSSGEVEIEEFLVGCHKLQGESRNLDMKVMQMEVRWIQETLNKLGAAIAHLAGPGLPTYKELVHVDLAAAQAGTS